MNVAFIAHYGAFAYGANRSLVNLIDGLREHGVRPHVAFPTPGSLQGALAERNIQAQQIPFALWMDPAPTPRSVVRRLRSNLRCVPILARQIREWGCDVIYTNSSVVPIGAMVAAYTRKPHVWHIREFGDLDHGLRHDWGTPLARAVIKVSGEKIAVSQAVKDYVLRGSAARRSRVIYNGIASTEQFDRLLQESEACKAPSTKPYTFTLIGQFRPSKGQDEAINALALLRGENARLQIVGTGDESYIASCKALANTLGVADRVEFCGYERDPFRVLLAADAVLMCSRNEAMGRVTVEAMAAARPVIGFDRAGTSELIQNEQNGLLYRSGSEDLARCMQRLVRDRDWSRQLGINGWTSARSKYTIEAYAEQVNQVLLDAVNRTR